MAYARGTTTRPPPPKKRPPPRYEGDLRPITDMPVLKTIWKAMNLPGKPPPVWTDASMRPGLAGYFRPFAGRRVFMDPEWADTLKTLGFPGHRDYRGLGVLAHEYAHAAQPLVSPKRVAEGGAEAYTIQRWQQLLKALNAPALTPRTLGTAPYGETPRWWAAYPQMVMWAARQPGLVQRGQFGR